MTRVPFPSLFGLRPMLAAGIPVDGPSGRAFDGPARGTRGGRRYRESPAAVQTPDLESLPPSGRGILAPTGFGRPQPAPPSSCAPRPPGIPAGPGAVLPRPRCRNHRVVRRRRPGDPGNRLRHDDPRRRLPLEDPVRSRTAVDSANGWPIPRETSGNPFRPITRAPQ